MLFEIRKIPFHSIKEFGGEYLMIVVGILTALGAEHVITKRHHEHAAEQSRQQIVAEIRANLADVELSVRHNQDRTKPLEALTSVLTRKIKGGLSKTEFNRHVVRSEKELNFGLSWPTLRHEAWDVAVANQSAAYIDPADLRRYSAAYAYQRDAMTAVQVSMAFFSSSRLCDVMTDLRLERADPIDLLRVVQQTLAINQSIQGNLKELHDQLEVTLKEAPPKGSSATSAH